MRIVYVVGTRPNFVKTAPVIAALRARLPEGRHAIVHTGQHYDRLMSEVFLEELGVPAPDHMLEVGSGSHAQQTARVMERLEPVLAEERPDLVMVPGDVNSTLAAALTAAKMQIPVAHIEAGLRSFDRTMPEELNRIVTDQLSDQPLHPQPRGQRQPARRGNPGRAHPPRRQHDDRHPGGAGGALPRSRTRAAGSASSRAATSSSPCTAPPSSTARCWPRRWRDWRTLAREMPVVFPVHPRTREMMEAIDSEHPGLLLCEPLGYLDFLSLLADAGAVLTDSGGIQEETTYLGIPCFTLRANTERPITLTAGTNTLLGLDPAAIAQIPAALSQRPASPPEPPPLWDGHAAERIADIVAGGGRSLSRSERLGTFWSEPDLGRPQPGPPKS